MKRMIPLALAAAFLAGCELGYVPPDTTEQKTQLKTFDSETDLANYFRDQISRQSESVGTMMDAMDRDLATDDAGGADFDESAGAPVPAADGAAGGSTGNGATGDNSVAEVDTSADPDFSQTTTQEEGVDEADVVKTDGRYIYVISRGQLRIVRAVPADNMELVARVDLEGHGRELYLTGTQAVVLSEEYGGYHYPTVFLEDVDVAVDVAPVDGAGGATGSDNGGDGEIDDVKIEPAGDIAPAGPGGFAPMEYQRPKVIVTVVDLEDPADPVVTSTTRFDGSMSSSRMIAGELHLVMANYQHFFFDVMPMMGRPEFEVDTVDLSMMLPNYRYTGVDGTELSGSALTWDRVYRPAEPDGFGVLTIVSMKPEEAIDFKSVGVVAEPGMIYSSLSTLYLTNTDYNFEGQVRETTDIYKVRYTEDGPIPVAGGTVPGRVLNQYSMGEHNGYLRVATTVSQRFRFGGPEDGPVNNVYVLTEENGDLVISGRIEGIAPGETIQAARFVGDRGYVVTFEQIDPLFTLDMADPNQPAIIGELKVPGFSTYVVPIDQDHLLTVGQYIPEQTDRWRPWGVQLSIFDVTEFDNPVLEHLVVIGEEGGSWSEALHNPKAFTWFAEESLVALPVSIQERVFFDDFVEGGIAVDIADEAPEDRPTDDAGSNDGSTDDGGSDGDGDVGDDVDEPAPVDVDLPDYFYPPGFDGVIVFDVSIADGFTELGRLSLRSDNTQNYYWPSFMRGMFIGDSVYAVSDGMVRSALIDDMGDQHSVAIADPDFWFVDDIAVPQPDVRPTEPGTDAATGGGSSGSAGGATDPDRD